MSELNKVSNLHMGAGRQVFNDDDIQSQLTSFFNEYSMPLNWNNQFNYAGASEYDCSDTNVYEGQELTCIGKLSSSKECGGMIDLGFTKGNTLLAGDNLIDVSTVIVLFAQKYAFVINNFRLTLAKSSIMLIVLQEAMLLLYMTALT